VGPTKTGFLAYAAGQTVAMPFTKKERMEDLFREDHDSRLQK
jgi:hypothetical protein